MDIIMEYSKLSNQNRRHTLKFAENDQPTYGTAQFKLDIYTRVTLEFLDKFLAPLMSYTRENH